MSSYAWNVERCSVCTGPTGIYRDDPDKCMVENAMPKHLVNRDFDRLWCGQAVSLIGDAVFDTTLMIWVARVLLADSRWAPAAAGGLMMCAFTAVMVVGPAAGVFVDRWPPRRTMLGSEVVRGVLVALLWLLVVLPHGDLPVWLWLTVIYLTVFVVNSAGQFFRPARFAAIGEIVPGEADRTKALGMSQATAAAAAIVGPPLAAPLLFTVGMQWALLANVLSYLVSYLAIRSVRFPDDVSGDASAPVTDAGTRSTWRADLVAGLRMFAQNRLLVALLTIFVTAELGAGSISALNIFFLTDNLRTSANLLGVLSLAIGLGAIVGALMAGRIAALVGARTLTWLGMICGGALFAVYARQTSLAPAMVCAFLFMIPVAAFNSGLGPLLLAATPRGFTGRVMAVIGPVTTAASMLSVVTTGWLASTRLHDFHATVIGVHLGPIDVIFTACAILIIGAGTYGCVALPRLGAQSVPGAATGEA